MQTSLIDPAPPAAPAPTSRFSRWFELLSRFLAGQLAVQALNFTVGFFLLRWLDKQAYAQYSVAFAFQGTVGMLVDLGFTGSIIALVGEHAHDPAVVGRYVRTARYFRTRSFIAIITCATFIYPVVLWKQPWGWQIKTLLYIGVFVGLAADNLLMYSSVLLMHRKINLFYRAQIVAGVWRQGMCFLLYVCRFLNSWTASWTSAIASAIFGWMYRRSALPLIFLPEHADPETNREMIRYIAPLMPGIIFTAFQGQVSIAVITFFGKTSNIAEVGALGRLGQIFTLLSSFNQVIIEPYIARVARSHLLLRYLQVIASQIVVGVLLSLFAFSFPGPLLWIIGPRYAQLRPEVGWVAMTASISYLCGGLWTMNSARKWIYWWGTAFYIGAITLTQVVCALRLQLSQTHGVIKFGFFTALSVLLVHAVHAAYGFRFGPSRRSVRKGGADGPEKPATENS